MDTADGIQSLEQTHSFCASKQAHVCILAFFDFLFFLDNRFQFLRFAWLNFGAMCVSRQRCRSTAPSAAAAQSGASSAEEHIADARVLAKCLCIHV